MVANAHAKEAIARLSGSMLALHDIVERLMETMSEAEISSSLEAAISGIALRVRDMPPEISVHYRAELVRIEQALHTPEGFPRALLNLMKGHLDTDYNLTG